MTSIGLTPGAAFLRDAARQFFEDLYGSPTMHQDQQLHKDLSWTPALRFTIHEQINVFVEPSESGPYPRILELKASEVRLFPQPISIYAVCPEESLLGASQGQELKRLEADGFGLITVDASGTAKRLVSTIPLIQIISASEIRKELAELTPKIRQRVSEAFEDYCNKPVNGVRSLSEVVEGLVEQAGRDAVRKQYIANAAHKAGPADTLDALYQSSYCHNIRAQVGGVRSYIAEYRNLSHHWPKNAKRAHKKYSDCRHAFLDGIKQLQRFRGAVRGIGLTGNLPRS